MSGDLRTLYALPADHVFNRSPRALLGLGVIGLAIAGAGALVDHAQFFRSYLVAFVFWGGIAIGSLALVSMNHIAGGRWGIVIRRAAEAAMRTLPLVAVLFVPLLFGMHDLYEWTHAEHVAHDPVLQYKTWYLNVPFFILRAALYFIIWFVLAGVLLRWSAQQDATGDPGYVRKFQLLGSGAVLVYVLTMTFASVDWMMSIEPHWYSTIYGLMVIGGQIMTAFTFAITILTLLTAYDPVRRVATADRFHDLGKMLFAFVMLYAYFSFSQFLIIWSGNLPEETPWYLKRVTGGWEVLAIALILFHFFLPFFILLSRSLKRNARRLMFVAVLLLFMRWVGDYWMIMPAFSPGKFTFHWMDIAAMVGVGGIWLAAFLWNLQGRPVLPLHDPALPLEASV
ncbi:MAG: hypothetical protein AB7V27_12010 [Candidatus Binatia bacterium]